MTTTTNNNNNTNTANKVVVHAARYDSRIYRGSISRNYAMWTDGYAYRVSVDENVFYVGYHSNEGAYLVEVDPQEVESNEKYGDWRETSFSDIAVICQRKLVELMGDRFPWAESAWDSPEEFAEYINPQTLAGILAKSLRDSEYFYYKLVHHRGQHHQLWRSSIEHSLEIEFRRKPYEFEEGIVLIGGNYYRYWTGFDPRGGYYAHLEKSSLEEYEREARFLQEKEEKNRVERKEHARKCGVLSRKYGIPFVVVLRSFKGDENRVKAFADTLKSAIGNEFDGYELTCGRNRRRAEIERLGIEIGLVDPNYIADYILACLKAGKILSDKEYSPR